MPRQLVASRRPGLQVNGNVRVLGRKAKSQEISMSPHEVGSLAFKISGIFSIVRAIPLLQPILRSFYQWPSWDEMSNLKINYPLYIIGQMVPFIILIILGLLLILKSDSIAGRFLNAKSIAVKTVKAAEIQDIAFSVVGVFILALAVPRLLEIASTFVILLTSRATEGFLDYSSLDGYLARSWTMLFGTLTQLIVGAGLFFGGRSIGAFWRKIRSLKYETKGYKECPHCGHPFNPSEYREDAQKILCYNCKMEIPKALAKDTP